MSGNYTHYGWECSPYSSKTRAYLRFKQIPHEDIYPTLFHVKRVIEKKVGFVVMPVVICPDGTPLQDTSDIIEHFDAQFPARSIWPQTPTQDLVSLIFELFADEWFPLISLHTRWNMDENRRFATAEFGRCALPWLPGFLSKRMTQPMANKMRSYLPVLGITDVTRPLIDAWQDELFSALDKHFGEYPFLLGSRPCLGDFALYGPLYAHVWRDPGSRFMVEKHSHLLAWMKRVQEPKQELGRFIEKDRIPSTLHGIVARIFKEQWPVLQQTAAAVNQWMTNNPNSPKIPRSLGTLEFSIGSATAERKILTFQQWMMQRSLDYYHALEAADKSTVDAFLSQVGGLEFMNIQLTKRLTRKNFRVVPEH
ncbi:MAG TPA: glutathione S-transferase family protein [Myxococcales bacterium]|nr:glutathione S-transferase family protein [Myxococcales bacterium]